MLARRVGGGSRHNNTPIPKVSIWRGTRILHDLLICVPAPPALLNQRRSESPHILCPLQGYRGSKADFRPPVFEKWIKKKKGRKIWRAQKFAYIYIHLSDVSASFLSLFRFIFVIYAVNGSLVKGLHLQRLSDEVYV